MLAFKDSFVVCVILNKVKNLKIYRYFATLRRVVEGLPEK